MRKKKLPRQSLFFYRITQVVSWFVAVFVFRRKMLRNEIKGKKGPFVIIANHEARYDFVNLIGATAVPMTFVISEAFYNTLPVKGVMDRMGVIPKQQFHTGIRDIKRMKETVEGGRILVLYPAGLMSEDGLSTPIPAATYAFLQWLGVDVYVARSEGTYLAMPKWSTGTRRGRTYLDIYKLFSAEELASLDVEAVRRKTDEALFFDAYREQEARRIRYRRGNDIRGLENVLYMCPHCGTEFSVVAEGASTLRCTACGFSEVCDEYGFLHKTGDVGEEIRYVSDWSRVIYRALRHKLERGEEGTLSCETAIHLIDKKKYKFCEAGRATLSLSADGFRLCGTLRGEALDLSIPITNFASLPFSPGKNLEIQYGSEIYRCVLDDGRLAMKFVNLVKLYYEKNVKECREAATK